MRIVDLNILLYAVNRNAPQHSKVCPWLERAFRDGEPVGLPWAALLGFLRISTHPQIFPRPLSLKQALEKVDIWLSHPHAKIVQETSEHWRILRSLLEDSGTAGNLTSDAHLAALAISYGAVLVSCDADFARFDRLRWENPLHSRK